MSRMNPTQQLERVHSELLCSICCDYFVRAFTMSCSHSFCYNCIFEWRRNNGNCPICREHIYSMAPSRALDNMVVALNGNANRMNVGNIVAEVSPTEINRPHVLSDSVVEIDDDYDTDHWIESDHEISDENSNLSDDSRSYSFDIGSSNLDINDMDDFDVSRSSIFTTEGDIVSPETEELFDYEDSDNISIFSSYSSRSTAENMTIKHIIEFC